MSLGPDSSDQLEYHRVHNDLGPVPTSGNIQVEEVTVKDGLYYSRHHGDLIIEILCLVPPDPVG